VEAFVVSLHIEFCLDEIDCEIEAASDCGLDDIDRVSLQRHIAGMRAIIAFARMRRAAHPHVCDVAEDDLTLVKGIGLAEQKILKDAGVRTFAEIASWRRHDIKAFGQHGIPFRRIARENWIEQAAVLAAGGQTHYAALSRAPEIRAEPAAQPVKAVPQSLTVLDVTPTVEVEEVFDSRFAVIPFKSPTHRPPSRGDQGPWTRALTAAALSILIAVGFVGELKFGAIETMVVSSLPPIK